MNEEEAKAVHEARQHSYRLGDKIARTIMEWFLVDYGCEGSQWFERRDHHSVGPMCLRSWDTNMGICWTDIATKMIGLDWKIKLDSNGPQGKWNCTMWHPDIRSYAAGYTHFYDTAELAICYTALTAMKKHKKVLNET